MLTLVLLLYPFVPLSQKIEWIGVCDIVDKNDLICFAQQIKGNLFKNVLTRDVDKVKFNGAVGSLLGFDFFY